MSEKNIVINGQNNKYRMKKVLPTQCDTNANKKDKLLLDEKYYHADNQLDLLLNSDSNIVSVIETLVKTKLSGYKQQDKKKGVFQTDKFITTLEVIDLLKSISCKCYYCNIDMLLYYNKRNDKRQWTLDRINNDIGHNRENVVCSCLSCNIQKRARDHEKFLFTKTLNIIKGD